MPAPRLLHAPRIYLTDLGEGPANPTLDDFKFDVATRQMRKFSDTGAWQLHGSGLFLPGAVPTQEATAGAATYTTAQILAGIIDRDPNGASRTDVTPTAALIIANCGLEQNGDIVWCWLINTADAAETITLSAGAGVTISNVGQTLAQNESAQLIFQRTGAAAVKLYICGA